MNIGNKYSDFNNLIRNAGTASQSVKLARRAAFADRFGS